MKRVINTLKGCKKTEGKQKMLTESKISLKMLNKVKNL